MRFDYVTVGHVTVDVLADASAAGLRQPGGGAFYSALQAARLGLRTLILTRGVPQELEELLAPYRPELEVAIAPAEHTTTLRTRGRGRGRTQRLLAWAGPIAEPVALDTAILHLAPIARETPRAWHGEAGFVGLTPQGLVRDWDARGAVARAPLVRERLPARRDAIVFSATERAGCEELIPGSGLGAMVAPGSAPGGMVLPGSGPGPIVVPGSAPGAMVAPGPAVAVTAGPGPTTVLVAGRAPLSVAVPPLADPRDDLGAGDVFAAAFFVALHEGLAPAAAAAFANAAAAVRIAGAGPGAIGDRSAVQARLRGSEPPAAG